MSGIRSHLRRMSPMTRLSQLSLVVLILAGATAPAVVGMTGCVSLPPDRVTAENYAAVSAGMTKDQVFAILGPGVQQSETTMGGTTLENYGWSPRDDYSRSRLIVVSFKNGVEMSKVKVGF
jgi:hypothetical protein